MKQIINWASYSIGVHNPAKEVNDLPSETQPGMALTMRQLMDKYVRGQATFVPVYTDDPDIPDNIERMDNIDRLDMARDLRGYIDRGQEELFQRQEERKKKKVAPPSPTSPDEGESIVPPE